MTQGAISRGLLLLVAMLAAGPAVPQEEQPFDDPLFRRCINWMMSGYRGALIDNLCLEYYRIPPPTLFLCAQKIQDGFASKNDREGCAIIFDEQARKARAGFIR